MTAEIRLLDNIGALWHILQIFQGIPIKFIHRRILWKIMSLHPVKGRQGDRKLVRVGSVRYPADLI